MRALVFSAGGSFCAYQAGVWQALEEHGWRPQIVVGVSAGALNAVAVARG
jgi:NTE family protein